MTIRRAFIFIGAILRLILIELSRFRPLYLEVGIEKHSLRQRRRYKFVENLRNETAKEEEDYG